MAGRKTKNSILKVAFCEFVLLFVYSRVQVLFVTIIPKSMALLATFVTTLTCILLMRYQHYNSKNYGDNGHTYCDMSTSCWVALQGLRSGALLRRRPLNNSRPNTRCAAVRGGGVFSAHPR
jgi:hypothetical protein